MSKITIRQLAATDWLDYRSMRLESLELHPDCFSPSRDETKFSQSDWESRLSSNLSASFGLYVDGVIVGITTVFIDNPESGADSAQFVGSYLKKEYRKQGLSKLFYESRFNWASERGVRKVRLEHRLDNESSRLAHQRYGFTQVGSCDQLWPDGKTIPSLMFELVIDEMPK